MKFVDPIPQRLRSAVHRSRSRAFTLLELLLVVGVVGVLAGMALPVLGTARKQGLGVECLGQLRQWGLATQLYAAENQGLLPPEGFPNPGLTDTNRGWYVQLPAMLGLRPYGHEAWRTNPAAQPARSLWLCPANRRRSNGLNLFHYCLNGWLDGEGDTDRTLRLEGVDGASEAVWLFDSKNLPAVGGPTFVHTNVHRAGANLLLLDGHAARFPARAYRDPLSGAARTNVPGLRWTL